MLGGQVAATLEFKHRNELTVDSFCEKALPFFIKDDGDFSVSKLKEEYEAQIKKQKAAAKSRKSLGVAQPKTAKEREGFSIKVPDALRAVGDPKGAFNWALLEASNLDLHNAGYGGVEEMKEWLDADKVLFGIIRFSFGRLSGGCGATSMPTIVKHVFVHWIGPKVSPIKRGQWNSKHGTAETQIKKACPVLTFSKEAHDHDDLEVGYLISELKRLSIIDGDKGENTSGEISVEEYMAALEAERAEQLLAAGGMVDEHSAPLPEVKEGVNAVRSQVEGSINWILIGVDRPS